MTVIRQPRWLLVLSVISLCAGSARAADPKGTHATAPHETKADGAHGSDPGHAAGHESPSLFTGDLGNIIWTLATFFAVVIVLGRFAWRPILTGLKKREDFIRESLELAKREREMSEARLREYTDKLNVARAEATAIVEEGRRDAEAVKRKIEETARVEAAAMVERAKREIGIATDTAVKELHSRAAKLATDVASKIIRKQLDPKEHERLVRDSIAEFEKASVN